MTPYEPPPDFLQAKKKHQLPDPTRTAGAIWDALQTWQRIPVNVQLAGEPDFLYRRRVCRTESFEAKLVYAIKSGDRTFNEQRQKAEESQTRPQERITAYQAGVAAFDALFNPSKIETVKANWPSKKDVIGLATAILQNAGQSVPSKRHWSRVLGKIGLEDLPESLARRPRKLVT